MKTITQQPMGEQILILDEPRLQFAGGHYAHDPHDGLALFGPYSEHFASLSHIVIGTTEGIELWRTWASALNRPAAVIDRDQRLWPPFPGFDVAFGIRWPERPQREFTIDRDQQLRASRKRDRHERCFAVVDPVLQCFDRAKKLDAQPTVAVCIVPDDVWTNCRPESYVADPVDDGLSRKQKRSRMAGQLDLFDEFDPEQYRLSPDFRRQLKARLMQYDIPIQVIRESTLRLSDSAPFGSRRLTLLSDRMWNIATALYYKAGGKPWKLHDARQGVCYIGLAFRCAPKGPETACCAAQMFLDSGDGIVFLGEYGPWYSPENKQFRLSPDAAENLLRGALKTYNGLKSKGDPPVREIFLHSRSTISREEFEGYRRACPADCTLVGIRVRRDRFGLRLYRNGKMPVLRGTFLKLDGRSGYLFASGFKPRLATYDGWEVPAPLRIDIQHGQAEIETVARDILALTKLNYNACKLGDSEPVTILFSDAVGEILVSNPTVTDRRPNFKYYI